MENTTEYMFLDRLEFLARGGRLAKTKAFFGDLFHKKPVVTPTPEGVRKVDVVGTHQQQVDWLKAHLERELPREGPLIVMMEYTDNRDRIAGIVEHVITPLRPDVDVLIRPFSLTTGVHIGPGSWGIAFLPLPAEWGK
jgi:fatty acid-binding protein DegV